MDCADTRSLIDQCVAPGAAEPLRTALGFHLAACPSCRAYHTQTTAHRLLHELLVQSVHVTPFATRLAAPPARRTRLRRYTLGAALIICACATIPLQPAIWATAVAAAPAVSTMDVRPNRSIAPAGKPQAVRAPATDRAMLVALLNERAPAVTQSQSPADDLFDPDLRVYLRERAPRVPSTTNNSAGALGRLAPAQPNSAQATAAMFTPEAGVAMARSQLFAFAQAGPQAMPPQMLHATVDAALADLPLEVGQTIVLPDDTVVPEPPPPTVEVVGLVEPQIPAPPRQPAKPAKPIAQPKPIKPVVTRPVTVVKPARRYVIQPGDTLSAIALRFYEDASSWQRIYAANSALIGANPNLILPNQQLVLPNVAPTGGSTVNPGAPAPAQHYTVRSGDTLSAIALARYGNADLWPLIYTANHGTIGGNPDLIFPQQTFAIPQQASKPTPKS